MTDKKYYIYMFKNNNDEVIYVGKTSRNIYRRIREHIKDKDWILAVKHILITEVSNPVDQDVAEIYYINKYHPKYNELNDYKDINYISDIFKIKNLKFHELTIVECFLLGMRNNQKKDKRKKEIIFVNYFNVFNPLIYEEYKHAIFQYNDNSIKIDFTEKDMSIIDYLETIYVLNNLLGNNKNIVFSQIKENLDLHILTKISEEKLSIIINDIKYKFIDKFVFFEEDQKIPCKIIFNKEFIKMQKDYNLHIL